MEFMSKCSQAMAAYHHLTQDNSFASRVKNGRMQLVRVSYEANGKSRIEQCGPWVPVSEWLSWLSAQMI